MYAEGGTFKDYPDDFQRRLEMAFQTKLSTIEFKDSTGKKQKFVVDTFRDETKKTRIRRILTTGKCVYIWLLCHMHFVGH